MELLLEPRLQERYDVLVAEHLSPVHAVAAGLRALPGGGEAMAATQAAYRFYRNEDVTLAALLDPLLAQARAALETECDAFGLVVHDGSDLVYSRHTRKQDRIGIGGGKGARGYVLASSLLISDRDGEPLSPVAHSLWASDGIHTTRTTQVVPDATLLDEVSEAIEAIEALGWDKPLVHIIDREADSVGHFRRWQQAGVGVLVRVSEHQRVEYEGRSVLLSAVPEHLAFRFAHEVEVGGGLAAALLVAETQVTITRAARPHRQRDGVKQPRRSVAGEPVSMRLVVCEVRLPDETVGTRWLLLTNLQKVSAERLAQWYYRRWRVESYFKLLKKAGLHVEQWQQESAEAVSKRLLVGAMAAVVVWRLARAEGEQAEASRRLLVRLSGRQMRYGTRFTEPALMAGMWVLLSTLDALEHYTLDDMRQVARFLFPGSTRFDSS